MSDFVISNVDSAFIKVDCDKGFGKELSDFFTFTVPGHRYMPAFRKKIWDGKIKLFNYYKREIYAGLEDYVVQFARDRNYTIEGQRPYSENQQSLEASRVYTESLQPCSGGQELVPHEHQINAINHAINKNRCLLLSPTASGKSLIIYTLVRHYLERIGKNKKILIIVPTISLVTQMYSDFMEYSSKGKWKARNTCHKIYGGQSNDTDKQVVISTWQSIYKLPNTYFEQFEAVFGDECLHPNTKISMADGTLKDIKNIVIGDIIKTINEITKKIETKQVLKVHKNISINEQMYEVCLNNNKIVKITGNHKVMLKTGEWKRVDELKVGNVINSIEGMTFDDQ